MVTRGTLRVYLGAAPGVGKTYTMLAEGRRRRERGTDVVIGFVETHGRARTAEQIGTLEVVPRRDLTYRDRAFTEMDLDAVLDRRPQVALIDELAHTNVPGTRNEKRWQDVEEILEAGIDVITTVNVQHLESLNDVVARITGLPQRETLPDEVVRRAGQVELVDMTPEALRRRLAHGNIYPPEKIDAALRNYFRAGNLAALRELALEWLADRVDEWLTRYRDRHGITRPWEARERVVVALTGGPEGDTLIRRAARIAARAGGADLLAVHVARSAGLADGSPDALRRQRALVESLGGSYHQVVGEGIERALLDFARGVNATQLILGSSRRRGWQFVLGPGVGATVAREAGDVDVHIVTHERAGRGRGPGRAAGSPLSPRRRLVGWAGAMLGPALLTVALAATREHHGLNTDLLLFLALTVVVALAGGLWPAIAAAVLGFALLNWYFTPPIHTWTIDEPENALALAVFVAVAVSVSSVVDLAARRTAQAARSGAEAETLSLLATSALRDRDRGRYEDSGLPALLDRVRETFGVRSVSLLERAGAGWATMGALGPDPCAEPEQADAQAAVGDGHVLALRGRVLPAADRRVLSAFASHAAAALEWQRLAAQAAQARRLAEGNKIRTALLAAVSHDLRTPLASIKAAVSSLRQTDMRWDPADEAELLAAIEESADRLNGLIGNLLDMSRLHTGAVAPRSSPVSLDEVVPRALLEVEAGRVEVDVPESLPAVLADPGLLERALANVVENAARHSAGPVLLAASVLGNAGDGSGRVELRVADRGPGVPDGEKETIFAPFQRLGDVPRGTGVGLGLAVARGFTEAMGGTLTAEDTPGGGLTMVFSLPAAARDRERT